MGVNMAVLYSGLPGELEPALPQGPRTQGAPVPVQLRRAAAGGPPLPGQNTVLLVCGVLSGGSNNHPVPPNLWKGGMAPLHARWQTGYFVRQVVSGRSE